MESTTTKGTLENQPESFISEALSLISVDVNFVNLTRNGEPNNLYVHLARYGHCQRKWRTVSSSSTDLHPRQKSLNSNTIFSAYLPIMMSRQSPSNWLVRLLYIKDQVSLAVEQNSTLTQDKLASRNSALANLTKASDTPNSI